MLIPWASPTCILCLNDAPLTVEHVIPASLGGKLTALLHNRRNRCPYRLKRAFLAPRRAQVCAAKPACRATFFDCATKPPRMRHGHVRRPQVTTDARPSGAVQRSSTACGTSQASRYSTVAPIGEIAVLWREADQLPEAPLASANEWLRTAAVILPQDVEAPVPVCRYGR